jgi:hypothetical protein
MDKQTEALEVHADLLSEYDLVPLPIPGGEAPVLRAIQSGRPVKVVGFDRATPRVQARLRQALGLGPFDEVPQ